MRVSAHAARGRADLRERLGQIESEDHRMPGHDRRIKAVFCGCGLGKSERGVESRMWLFGEVIAFQVERAWMW